MFRHNKLDHLRERIAMEDRLATHGETMEIRRVHAELAILYRAEMRALKSQVLRFGGRPSSV